MGREGFEPPKAKPIDLQSTPVGHFGISPIIFWFIQGAEGGIRTHDLMITNQLLWPTELLRLFIQ